MADPLEHVGTEITDRIATLTIHRSAAGNSLTPAMRDDLATQFEALSGDLSVRAVVLTGSGDRHFCTGAGLGGPPPTAPARPDGAPDRVAGEVARVIRRGWQRLISAVLDCEKPVVAAVNGTAAGGGAHLVLAADLVLMADTAKLVEVFVNRGILPDAGGCYLLPRIVGPQRAKELMFFGDALDAADCERYGIANHVVPAAELPTAAQAWARRLCEAPTVAIAATKWLLGRSFEVSRQTAFEEEALAQELVFGTADAGEGVRAFGERRPPLFLGW